MAGYWNLSRIQQHDLNGEPLIGARVSFYQAGTTTPLVTYQDASLALEHPHPVEADGYGRFPGVYFDEGDEFYRMRVTDADGALIFDDDTIPIIGPTGIGGDAAVPVDQNALLKTGDVKWRYGTGAILGFVRVNGRSIGSATSGATERANADVQPLYEYLWAADASLAVAGTRGASAADDWSANKALSLPDMRGRTLFGLDDMGTAAAERIAAAYVTAGDPTTLGASGGLDDHTLITAEAPAHNHTATIGAGGNHGHPFRTATTDIEPQGGFLLGVSGQSNHPAHTGPLSTPAGQQIGASGTHVHSATIENTGGGGAHNNMPPFMLGTFYLKM